MMSTNKSREAEQETSADEIKTCPLCGGRVFWFPVSHYWGCENCKNTFNRYTVFPADVKKTSSAIGNAAAMREACQKMRDLLMLRGDGKVRCVLTWDEFNESQKMLRAALSAPPRNCDVGTAEEQFERWETFCMKYDNDCTGCPLNGYTHPTAYCFAKWAQMPYEAKEKGGAK